MRPEHWRFTIPLRLRSLFRRAQSDQELHRAGGWPDALPKGITADSDDHQEKGRAWLIPAPAVLPRISPPGLPPVAIGTLHRVQSAIFRFLGSI